MARLAGTVAPVPAGSTVLGPADGSATTDRRRGAASARPGRRSTPSLPPSRRPATPGTTATWRPGSSPRPSGRPRPRWRPPGRGWPPPGCRWGPPRPTACRCPSRGRPPRWRRPSPSRWSRPAWPRAGRPGSPPGTPWCPPRWPGRLAGVIGLGDQSVATPQIVRPTDPVPATGTPPAAPRPPPGRGRRRARPSAASRRPGPPPSWLDLRTVLALRQRPGRGGPDGRHLRARALHALGHPGVPGLLRHVASRCPTMPVDGGASGIQQGEAALDIEVVAGLAPGAVDRRLLRPQRHGTGPIDTYRGHGRPGRGQGPLDQLGPVRGADGPGRTGTERDLFAQAASPGPVDPGRGLGRQRVERLLCRATPNGRPSWRWTTRPTSPT